MYNLLSCVFFFKQKTAYEMRISDWSSDVCSSDLSNYAAAKAGIIAFSKSLAKEIGSRGVTVNVVAPGFIATDMTRDLPEASKEALVQQIALGRLGEPSDIAQAVAFLAGPAARSEEHTSELQSLLRISYAVFCLKKKNTVMM